MRLKPAEYLADPAYEGKRLHSQNWRFVPLTEANSHFNCAISEHRKSQFREQMQGKNCAQKRAKVPGLA